MTREVFQKPGSERRLCSEDVTVKQAPECHTLANRKTHTDQALQQTASLLCLPPLCSTTALFYQAECSDSVGGFNSESHLKHLVRPNTAQGNLLRVEKDKLRFPEMKLVFLWERKSRALPVWAGRMEKCCSWCH